MLSLSVKFPVTNGRFEIRKTIMVLINIKSNLGTIFCNLCRQILYLFLILIIINVVATKKEMVKK